MADLPPLFGKSGNKIEFQTGTACPADVPMIVGAEAGFACLDIGVRGWGEDGGQILALAEAMRAADDGLYGSASTLVGCPTTPC